MRIGRGGKPLSGLVGIRLKDEKEYHAQDSERYSGNMTSDITNRNIGTGGISMDGKKTTVNLTAENLQKIHKLAKETGRTQTALINQAISEIPIVVLVHRSIINWTF